MSIHQARAQHHLLPNQWSCHDPSPEGLSRGATTVMRCPEIETAPSKIAGRENRQDDARPQDEWELAGILHSFVAVTPAGCLPDLEPRRSTLQRAASWRVRLVRARPCVSGLCTCYGRLRSAARSSWRTMSMAAYRSFSTSSAKRSGPGSDRRMRAGELPFRRFGLVMFQSHPGVRRERCSFSSLSIRSMMWSSMDFVRVTLCVERSSSCSYHAIAEG